MASGLEKARRLRHFENVGRILARPTPTLFIVRLENKWFWIIPLNAEKTSVGLVVDKE